MLSSYCYCGGVNVIQSTKPFTFVPFFAYRQKFPRLESKNVQFWFKNRRAKCKRLKMSLYDSPHIPDLGPFAHSLKRE